MWISVSRSLDAYFEDRLFLTSYNTGQQVEMDLVLYRQVTETFMARGIARKPVVKFFDISSGSEINPGRWTGEMSARAGTLIREHPVPNPGTKLSMAGKLISFALIAAILTAVASFVYMVVLKVPQNNIAKADFLQLPSPGDRYYGTFSGSHFIEGGVLRGGWVKVNKMNADSTGEILMGSEITDYTFDTRKIDHSRFNGTAYQVRFKVNGNGLLFRVMESDVRFESSPVNNKYSNYKIPVKQ